MDMFVRENSGQAGTYFEGMVADIFKRAGWQILDDRGPDLIVKDSSGGYVVEVKSAAEGRRDRLIPLLSQAILEAQSLANRFAGHGNPLAIVAAKYVPPSVADQIRSFAESYAPHVAVGVVDAEGLRRFSGPGLESLNAEPAQTGQRRIASSKHVTDLFSDLNQWMLKVLVGQDLAPSLLSVQRQPIQNASRLAAAANVSLMTASRLLNQLENEGFLERQRRRLQIVRVDELLDRWIAASPRPSRDIPARFIVKKEEKEFLEDVAKYASEREPGISPPFDPRPRCCLGLFAAANALGAGFVRGVAPHLYLERLEMDSLEKLGLSLDGAEYRPDVLIRVPANREAIFRAAVVRDGLPVCDLLQVWLDVSTHPSRGREQADEIWRRVLKPLFGDRE